MDTAKRQPHVMAWMALNIYPFNARLTPALDRIGCLRSCIDNEKQVKPHQSQALILPSTNSNSGHRERGFDAAAEVKSKKMWHNRKKYPRVSRVRSRKATILLRSD